MRIAILTGGGDVPGLNACIKALVHRIIDEGHEPVGVRRGWDGLLSYHPEDDEASRARNLMRLDKLVVRTVDRSGGTFLHTSRRNPGRVKHEDLPEFLRSRGLGQPGEVVDATAHVLAVLGHLGIDLLVPIGGEDTLGYAARIHGEGFPVVSIPKTMDNDVYGTDYCIGFSTAVTRSVEMIHQLRTSFGSHERIGVVELFGRHSGQTSLVSAYLAGVDRAVISEVPFDIAKLAELLVRDKKANPSNYSVLTMSEGAHEVDGRPMYDTDVDAYGHPKLGGIGIVTAQKLERMLGLKTMCQRLGYLMRSGGPDSLDVMVAVNFANIALDLALAGRSGRMVALRQGRYTDVSADTPSQGAKTVDVDALYDTETYRPKARSLLNKPMFLY